MPDPKRYAVFVLEPTLDFYDRRSALHPRPERLLRFLREDEILAAIADDDKDVIGGPEELVAEACFPGRFFRELIRKGMLEVVIDGMSTAVRS